MRDFDIIARYFSGIPGAMDGAINNTADDALLCGIGDDAAVIAVAEEQAIVVATDSFIEGVHFPAATPALAVGHKCLAVNLSDLAAMGAAPRWSTLAITLPPAYRNDAWLQGFRRGFHALAGRYGVSLVGGDTCAGAELSITVQVLGMAAPGQLIYRRGARVGDGLYVTGELGTAAYALRRLQAGKKISEEALARLYQPEPQVEPGLRLRHKATAMIDISDGLLADVQRLLTASEVGAVIDVHKIPVNPILRQDLSEHALRQCVLGGGDDYQLCFASNMPPPALALQLDSAVFEIGRVTAGKGIRLIEQDGTERQAKISGFQHF